MSTAHQSITTAACESPCDAPRRLSAGFAVVQGYLSAALDQSGCADRSSKRSQSMALCVDENSAVKIRGKAEMRCLTAILLLLACMAAADRADEAQFYALVDAGSQGTRIYVFAWRESDVLGSFHEVASKRLLPGLSSMASAPERVAEQLGRLCDFAEAHIPVTNHANTRLAIMATAGLRLLPQDEQDRIMEQALDALDGQCDFHLDRSVSGVISGEQEALFDWLATNTIFGTLGGEHVAAVDLGGASTQIAVPIPKGLHGRRLGESESCPSTSIPLSNGQSVEVYATSLLGFGLLSAMNHVLDHLKGAPHPCLPLGSYPAGTLEDFDRELHGAGSFDECRSVIRSAFKPLLESRPVRPCISTGSFSVMVAMDNYPKVVELLKLNVTNPNLEDIETGGRMLCKMAWEEICDSSPSIPNYRCQKACFGTAYVSFLLRDVYGLSEAHSASATQPLSVDFRSRHRDFEINWPVGAAVHHLLHSMAR